MKYKPNQLLKCKRGHSDVLVEGDTYEVLLFIPANSGAEDYIGPIMRDTVIVSHTPSHARCYPFAWDCDRFEPV